MVAIPRAHLAQIRKPKTALAIALGYYERWLRSIAALMVEKGVIRQEDLA